MLNHHISQWIALRDAFGQSKEGFLQPRFQAGDESIERALHRHAGIEHIGKIVICSGKFTFHRRPL